MPTPPPSPQLRDLAARVLALAGPRAQATAWWEMRTSSNGTSTEHTRVQVACLDRGPGVAETDDVGDAGLREAAERAREAAAGSDGAAFELPEPVPGRPHEGWDPALLGGVDALDGLSAGAPEAARLSWRLGAARTAIRSTAGVDAYEQRSFAELRLSRAAGRRTLVAVGAGIGPATIDASALFARLPADGEPPSAAPTGELPVVLGPEAVAVVLDLVRPHFGVLAARGEGAVAGALGRRIVAPCINLSDSPRYPATLPRSYDAEGVPRQPLPLVQDGVAHRVVRDSATGGGPSTGHATLPFHAAPAPEHLVLVGGGAADEEELMKPVPSGIYVPALGAGGTMALGLRAIENGRPGAPLLDTPVHVDGLAVLAAAQALSMGQRLVPGDDDSARTVGASVCPALRAGGGVVFGSS